MWLITRSGGLCRTGFMLSRLPVLTELKQRISDEWDKSDQQLIDSAIKQWHKHLAARVSARDGHKAEVQIDQQSTAVIRKCCI